MSSHRLHSQRIVELAAHRSRAMSVVEPDYRLCRWCGLVRNLGRDECPPHLRSLKEIGRAKVEAIEALKREQLARRQIA